MEKTDNDNFLPLPIHTALQQEVAVVPDGTTFNDVARKIVERNGGKKDFDETFLLGDLGILVEQFKRFKQELPEVEIFYAIKANALQPVLSIFAALGCGFDAASKCEIDMALKTGVQRDKIIYANPCKFASHILHARENDVTMTVFDNEEELLKMKKLFPNSKLVLRIETDDATARSQFKGKFGVELDTGKKLIKKARELDLNVIGISFHVGSGCPSDDSYRKAIEDSKQLFDFAQEVGFEFKLLDIGGGFPGSEEAENIMPFEKTAAVIRGNLEKHFPATSGVRIISEPGRYLPGPAFEAVTNIFAKKIEQDHVYYYVGESLYMSFTSTLMENFSAFPQPLQSTKGNPRPCTIFGCSLDGSDVIARSKSLPEMDVGDWIKWKDMGAYSCYCRFGFNGFTTHKACYYITKSKFQELKELCVHPELLPPTKNEI